jgi:transcriptional regulator
MGISDVLRLRELGLTCREIGDLFGVSRAAIAKLVQRHALDRHADRDG